MSDALKTELAARVTEALKRRLGDATPEMAQIVTEELELALGDEHTRGLIGAARAHHNGSVPERIVVTANGRNAAGIVARLAAAIDEFSGDIRDISQTIVGDYFTMIIVVDIGGATHEGARFAQVRERLKQVGDELGVHVVALHDDILSTMHGV